MIIGILIGLALAWGLICVFGGVVKKIMEVVSLIAKLCMCGGVAAALFQLVGIQFDNGWKGFLFIVIGALVLFGLMMLLSSMFRLVGYSINYMITSIILLLVVTILGDKVEIGFWMYTLLLLLFPRVMWISDRVATVSEYSHTEYSFWSDTETWVYNTFAKDWWEDSGDSWRCIPVQIAIAAFFYICGSVTMLGVCPIDNDWLMALFIILAVVVNVAFDYFVMRKVEETFF